MVRRIWKDHRSRVGAAARSRDAGLVSAQAWARGQAFKPRASSGEKPEGAAASASSDKPDSATHQHEPYTEEPSEQRTTRLQYSYVCLLYMYHCF